MCTFSGANTSACVTIEYWSWFWNWSPIISSITTISHTLWSTTCNFPTLFLLDFKLTKLNLSCFSWFSPWDIQKQHCGKKNWQNAISATLMLRSFAHAHEVEQAVNLSLGRSLINIWKFSFPPFKLWNNPWNNVGTRRTKKFLNCCSYAATQPWLVLRYYCVTSCLTANSPQACTLSGR